MHTLDEGAVYLFHDGSNAYAYRLLGAHPHTQDGVPGYRFATWAPNAEAVGLVGDFNNWDPLATPMRRTAQGIWTGFASVGMYAAYQYAIRTKRGVWQFKSDPYAFHAETRPRMASKTYDISGFQWTDEAFLQTRAQTNPYASPMNIYEVHLASWKRPDGRTPSYDELAQILVPYVQDMGYTHIELMPVMEHPLDMSWGYQVTGYFAATSRFGTPHGLMRLIDAFHNAGIGVLLDWVPAHFPRDAGGLRRFDGTPLYEYADTRKGEHPGWGTQVFDFGRKEVMSFLLSSAMFWLREFHADGLRVDAVSSMIYLDFERQPGQWAPNRYGGRENLEALELLRKLNTLAYRDFPGVCICAEESTDYPMVTKPVYIGGMGFGFKWNMGWMNDALRYLKLDPIYRKYHHDKITFSLMYAFSENFILPLSHDEVVHGKLSLLNRHPGDYWQKFAGLRAFFGFYMAHPGKKLLFMGGEFGQFIEWKYDEQLDWFLLEYPMHGALHHYMRVLNHFYRDNRVLWSIDDRWDGFGWLSANDADNSVFAFYRTDGAAYLVVVSNFTPCYHPDYRLGLPYAGTLEIVLNSDAPEYGGSGQGNIYPIRAQDIPWQEKPHSFCLSVPPLATVYLRYTPEIPLPRRPRTVRVCALSTEMRQKIAMRGAHDRNFACGDRSIPKIRARKRPNAHKHQ